MRKIPDELWDEIKIILPPEKPDKTIEDVPLYHSGKY
jgi:hypothetical protein